MRKSEYLQDSFIDKIEAPLLPMTHPILPGGTSKTDRISSSGATPSTIRLSAVITFNRIRLGVQTQLSEQFGNKRENTLFYLNLNLTFSSLSISDVMNTSVARKKLTKMHASLLKTLESQKLILGLFKRLIFTSKCS